jgi:hypothetical protein
MDEFKNFSAYIDKIDSKIGDAGLCKVIPPEGWYTPPTEAEFEKMWKEKQLLIPPIKQCVSGLRGIYQLGLMDSKKMSVEEFRALAHKNEPDEETSFEERERLFWRSMGPMTPPPLYGADMNGSLFRDEASGWNLAELDNMIKLLPSNLPGVTTAMLYFGMWRAMFAFHTEDMNLYSINFLHAGRPKSWYSIPPTSQKRFESLAQSLDPQGFRGCSEFMRHKTSIFSPKVLKESGIPFHTLVQEPGEFVITFPASYHAGFNHGFNVAEATNFTTERWLSKGREAKVCRCQPYSVHINMDDFAAKLEAKRAADRARVEALPIKTGKIERKRVLKRLGHTGWLAWHEQEEDARMLEETRAQKERQRLQRERTYMRRKEKVRGLQDGAYDPAVGAKRRAGGPDDHTSGGSEEETEGSLEEEGGGHAMEEDEEGREGEEEDLAEEEQWDFRCACGVVCSSEAPVASWPKGAMFQCTGCLSWSHTRCLYSKDVAPRKAFCAGCHQVLKTLEESSVNWHTGRQIDVRSRVVVCRGPRGLDEGTVTMLGEGMARVYFKGLKQPKKRKGGRRAIGEVKLSKEQVAPVEEWISLTSSRFLSRERIETALAAFKFQSAEARERGLKLEARKKTRLEQHQQQCQEEGQYHHRSFSSPSSSTPFSSSSSSSSSSAAAAASKPHHSSGMCVTSSSASGSGAVARAAAAATMAAATTLAGGFAAYPTSLLRGVPLPNADAAVRHAKFQKDLARSKKAFRGLFSRTQKVESAAGGFYRRYHGPQGQGTSVFDGEWSDDEEDEEEEGKEGQNRGDVSEGGDDPVVGAKTEEGSSGASSSSEGKGRQTAEPSKSIVSQDGGAAPTRTRSAPSSYYYYYPPPAPASPSSSSAAYQYLQQQHQQRTQAAQGHSHHHAASKPSSSSSSSPSSSSSSIMASAALGASTAPSGATASAATAEKGGWKYRVQVAPAKLNLPAGVCREDVRTMSGGKSEGATKAKAGAAAAAVAAGGTMAAH